jgi:hypothetical protein
MKIKTAGTYHDEHKNFFVQYRANIGKNNGSFSRAPAGTVEAYPATHDAEEVAIDLAVERARMRGCMLSFLSGEAGLYAAKDDDSDSDSDSSVDEGFDLDADRR